MVSPDEFEHANARGVQRRETGPTAVSARYDKRVHRVVIGLSSGIERSFLPHAAQGLEAARPADLDLIEISPSGLGLHFPKLDVDLYLPALLEGSLGSREWSAAQLGKPGGRAKHAAKAKAARGGRPRTASAT
ncbi:DUF2442 domain-containing protein [uncultured Thiodictyon sp.]|uniref:DUF2442 domain-containing protein n=1 Tax=uncultured Thiodictyon sp. TaxID=1846217 RepID=UPI0025D2AF5C|nr:DUF2442 domain-containing protein [uncultured Thiodictyon sp.]